MRASCQGSSYDDAFLWKVYVTVCGFHKQDEEDAAQNDDFAVKLLITWLKPCSCARDAIFIF